MMLEAEMQDKAMKEARKAEEARMEKEFRKKMMEKLAEEQRLEQLTVQRRKQKEFEHKKEVTLSSVWPDSAYFFKIERLWQQKLALYRKEREIEEMELRKKVEEDQYKQGVIDQEKEKLIKEHLPYIQNFLPKGFYQPGSDLKKLS